MVKLGMVRVAIFTKHKPLNVHYGIDAEGHPEEGRSITLEYQDFYFVGAYVPNSQSDLKRLDYRMKWEDDMTAYLSKLNEDKPVIYCGDLNVAHEEIDLKNPSTNRKNAGFSDEERAAFGRLLDAGFIDTFRYFYPTEEKYSWWSYRTNARARGIGWRIDYFIVSEDLEETIKDSIINDDVLGSDHCPVTLILHDDHLDY